MPYYVWLAVTLLVLAAVTGILLRRRSAKNKPFPVTLDDAGKELPYEPGTLVRDGSTQTSKIQETVLTDLRKRGFKLHAAGTSVQVKDGETYLRLSPDAVMVGSAVLIEVDPQGSVNHRNRHNSEDGRKADVRRNQLLEAAGFTVVRLRLGLGKGSAIGPHDVETESTYYLKSIADEFAAALRDAMAARPGRVRYVPRTANGRAGRGRRK